ncbi:MAG: (d)CMP kinase [Simkaniaceae bacterium]
MIITIDGPSGCGKSTVAKGLAQKLKYQHVDTGAIYRTLALFLSQKGVNCNDENEISKVIDGFRFSINKGRFFLFDEEVTIKIRQNEISRIASIISTYPVVRKKLLKIQQDEGRKSAVFEGRDMGTVVFPYADLKIYLTASRRVRAERRLLELKKKFPDKNFELNEIEQEISERDQRDSSRKLAPLKCPSDAILVDTSKRSIEEVVQTLFSQWKKVLNRRRFPFLLPKLKFFYRVTIFLTFCYFKSCHRLKVFGLENFRKGGGIVAPNHVSFFDPPIIASLYPEELHFLARETLFRGIFGRFIRALNSHPVKGGAGDIAVFKKVEGFIKKGKKVLLFPEGSRSITLQPIKPGVALICQRANSLIHPLYIDGVEKIWPRDRKFPKLFGGRISCYFGLPIYASDFNHLPKKEAMKEITKSIEKAFEELKTRANQTN